MPQQRFEKGDLVSHRYHGDGFVTYVEFNVIGMYRVMFARGSGHVKEYWIMDYELD